MPSSGYLEEDTSILIYKDRRSIFPVQAEFVNKLFIDYLCNQRNESFVPISNRAVERRRISNFFTSFTINKVANLTTPIIVIFHFLPLAPLTASTSSIDSELTPANVGCFMSFGSIFRALSKSASVYFL